MLGVERDVGADLRGLVQVDPLDGLTGQVESCVLRRIRVESADAAAIDPDSVGERETLVPVELSDRAERAGLPDLDRFLVVAADDGGIGRANASLRFEVFPGLHRTRTSRVGVDRVAGLEGGGALGLVTAEFDLGVGASLGLQSPDVGA